jgi:hypothetical protein
MDIIDNHSITGTTQSSLDRAYSYPGLIQANKNHSYGFRDKGWGMQVLWGGHVLVSRAFTCGNTPKTIQRITGNRYLSVKREMISNIIY